jgi:hypothetical protein
LHELLTRAADPMNHTHRKARDQETPDQAARDDAFNQTVDLIASFIGNSLPPSEMKAVAERLGVDENFYSLAQFLVNSQIEMTVAPSDPPLTHDELMILWTHAQGLHPELMEPVMKRILAAHPQRAEVLGTIQAIYRSPIGFMFREPFVPPTRRRASRKGRSAGAERSQPGDAPTV